MLDRAARVFVAGHGGTAGSAIVRRLAADGFEDLVVRTRAEADLTDRAAVEGLFRSTRPDVVVVAAARVGGIAANIADPVGFLVENLRIQENVLLACRDHEVRDVLFLASSCMYPRLAAQPMSEDVFMTGPVEPTNESYAIAKIAGVRLARALNDADGLDVRCAVPCNLYGPGDHFELERAHVVSALVRRFSEAVSTGADTVTLWGTGTARRELLHVDDFADACLFLLDHHHGADLVNVGTGTDHSIAQIAALVASATGFDGRIAWDTSKPDGMPRKVLDVTKLTRLGWQHRTPLELGVTDVVNDFRTRFADAR